MNVLEEWDLNLTEFAVAGSDRPGLFTHGNSSKKAPKRLG